MIYGKRVEDGDEQAADTKVYTGILDGEEIYRYPLQETARDTLNRQLRSGIDDDQLASLVINLREDNHLCQVHEQTEPEEPQIICSLGLFEGEDEV